MELNTVKVQEVKGSFFAYIPITWAREMNLKKGDEVTWSINEGNHKTLTLKKGVNGA